MRKIIDIGKQASSTMIALNANLLNYLGQLTNLKFVSVRRQHVQNLYQKPTSRHHRLPTLSILLELYWSTWSLSCVWNGWR